MRDLALEIRTTRVPAGAVAIWWLGQLGFVVKGGGRTVALDLYLSNYPGDVPRMYPPPIQPEALAGLDVVCCSHEHIDHIDPWTLDPVAVASPEAVFVVPEMCLPLVDGVLPRARVIPSRADEPLVAGGVPITPIPAAHDALEGAERGHRWQGFIFTLDGVTLCHTGDTVMYDGLVERLQEHKVDVLLAPINGRDYFRTRQDIIGNLSAREAADLAAAAGVPMLIPAHWDLFAANAENPGHLVEYLARTYPEQASHVMARGERFFYVSGR
jgi:L-ascorbate metabolism protein UlaG (beta-lactamase superfamily)